MEADERIKLVHDVEMTLWKEKFNHARTRLLPEWVSTFHPDKLQCHCEGDPVYGGYNVSQKLVFTDGTAWLVRFPRVESVCGTYADEKVAMEVEVISLIRARTTIPVPQIKAWGATGNNPLSLGPFIMMGFIEGLSLKQLFNEPKVDQPSSIFRADLTNREIETLYRQFAKFLLSLFSINFDKIGSLPTEHTGFPVSIRPMTWKVHDAKQSAAVDAFGDRSRGFSSTNEYFQYVLSQDWHQLFQQDNAIKHIGDAQIKYSALKTLRAFVPNFVHEQYNKGPFKLICDDLSLSNLMVKSREDLTVVGLIDFEWSYVGPAQLFGAAPWWLLLQDRMCCWDMVLKYGEQSQVLRTFLQHLDVFTRILEEEEDKLPGTQSRELSKLLMWSESSGALWFHVIIAGGFTDMRNIPFEQVRRHIGLEKFEEICMALYSTDAMQTFVTRKQMQTLQYERDLEAVKSQKAQVDDNTMTPEEFIINQLLRGPC